MKTIAQLGFAAALAAFIGVGAARASNIVQNPDFNGFSNWSSSGNSGYDFDYSGGPDGTYWWDGAVGSLGYQTQTLATTAGHDYSISFEIEPDLGYGYSYQVLWGGTTVFEVGDPNDGYAAHSGTWTDETSGSTTSLTGGEWNLITIDPFSSGTSTDISFGIRQDPGETGITGIDVEDLGSRGVPDRASTALLLGAALLGGLVLYRRLPAVE